MPDPAADYMPGSVPASGWRFFCLLLPALLFGTPPALAACQSITIFAAASTAEALEAVAKVHEEKYGCSVSTVFAGSGTLARQIAQGAPADLFLSASTNWMDWLEERNLLYQKSRTPLFGNTLALLGTTPSRQTPVLTARKLESLLSGKRWAMANADSVPAGVYTREALTRMGLWQKLKGNAVQSVSVRRALAWLRQGEIPFALGYASDARALEGVYVQGFLPASSHTAITYPLAITGRTPKPSARLFYQQMQSFQAASIFADYGFRRLENGP